MDDHGEFHGCATVTVAMRDIRTPCRVTLEPVRCSGRAQEVQTPAAIGDPRHQRVIEREDPAPPPELLCVSRAEEDMEIRDGRDLPRRNDGDASAPVTKSDAELIALAAVVAHDAMLGFAHVQQYGQLMCEPDNQAAIALRALLVRRGVVR
jgi:hypothetical protein